MEVGGEPRRLSGNAGAARRGRPLRRARAAKKPARSGADPAEEAVEVGAEGGAVLDPDAGVHFIAHFIDPFVFRRPKERLQQGHARKAATAPTKVSTLVTSSAYQVQMRRIPPLRAVRVFEAAARHENFTRAAAELGMTQAAVSYQIRLLEERLGVPLFLRSKRRVTLTEAGRKAGPLVASAFDTLSDAFDSVIAGDEGVLGISTTQTFASNWMAPRLGRFQIRRPELAVRLHTGIELVDFAGDEMDVAIRSGRGRWPGLRCHFLFHLHSAPMCSPDFRDRHGIAAPADLLRVARLSAEDSWWKTWFKVAGVAEPDVPPPPGIRLDSQVMEANAAMAGHGAAMLSPTFWRAELAAGRLVQLFAQHAIPGPSYRLVYPEHRRNQAKIRAFRDWILAEVEAQRATEPPEIFVEPAAPA
jgi:LysR family glycine cleavage system transcriptional activator